MPSTFPGMDPYIEASDVWGDFHTSLLTAIREQLNARLPKRFVAKIELYVWVHESEDRKSVRLMEPDTYVVDRSGRRKTKRGGVALADPIADPATIVLPSAERRRRKAVQIIDRESDRLVTALEVLSPANKKPVDERSAYLIKRNEYLAGQVNLVELDLLRGGRRLPLGEPPPGISDYYVLICRAWESPRAGLWSLTLRDPLPEIPVPLILDVPPVSLPLRLCMDRAYDGGRYDTELHYDRVLKPRPHKRDLAWVREILAARPTTELS